MQEQLTAVLFMRLISDSASGRREWDTRAGSIELQIPRLRQGTYYPEWLLERRRRAGRALATVVATSYLLGVSTRRVEKPAEQLGVTKLSKSQVSVMARELDELVTDFRNRPLDAGPYTNARDRRTHAEGARGRPHGHRALPGRHGRQRGRAAGDPRT